MAFCNKERTLLLLKEVVNDPSVYNVAMKLTLKLRIELHIYTNEWEALFYDKTELGSSDFQNIPGLTAKLLVMITGHVKALATKRFHGMIKPMKGSSDEFTTYMPCWKCYAKMSSTIMADSGNLADISFYIMIKWGKRTVGKKGTDF